MLHTSSYPSLIRGPAYDSVFIAGIAVLALILGLTAVAYPSLFPIILTLDVWLLGSHHVISTYTRIGFDRASIREHRFLVFYLPIIILGGVFIVGLGIDWWVIATTYLYWQWFHYTSQSYGVARFYLKKANTNLGYTSHPFLARWGLYTLPFWGILYRSYQAPDTFLMTELKVIPVAWPLVVAAAIVAGATIVWQLAEWGIEYYQKGSLPFGYVAYITSHYVIFGVGYLVIENIDYGWLVLNVWHNAQYILFVWLFNNNQYKNGIDPEHKLISTISQNGKIFQYFAVCLLVTLVFYLIIEMFSRAMALYLLLPSSLILFMTVNFHHYVVDGLIWKLRKNYASK